MTRTFFRTIQKLLVLSFYVTAPIAHFISLEVLHVSRRPRRIWSFTAGRHGPVIAVLGMEVIIYVAAETFRAMEPGADADKYSATEPLGPVIAIRRTIIGRDVIISVGTLGRRAYGDGHLRVGWGSAHHETDCSDCSNCQQLGCIHSVILIISRLIFYCAYIVPRNQGSAFGRRLIWPESTIPFYDKGLTPGSLIVLARYSPNSLFSGRKYIAGSKTKMQNDA